jgi:hypothetical protein
MSKALRATKCFRRSLAGLTRERVGATAHGIRPPGLRVFLAHRMAAAGRTPSETCTAVRPRTLVHHHADDLRDHIARALNHHRIANANINALRIG